MVTRRALLITGTASALVAFGGGAGLVGYAHWPGLRDAVAPWQRAGEDFGDPRLDALSYAILAPNPHNRQPWWFELVGGDEINVYCDPDRLLTHTDPPNRQITIGFGCMLELLRIAAAEKGYSASISPFPDGEPYPTLDHRRVATVRFRKDEPLRDPLFATILERRSLKAPYDPMRPVADDTLASLVQAADSALNVGYTVSKGRISELNQIAWDAWMTEYETPATRRESIDLMRIGNREVVDNPDGIEMPGISMRLLQMAGIVTKDALDTPGTVAYNSGIDMYKEIIHSAQGYVWMTAPENTRLSQLEAGRAWVRLNLQAQHLGLGMHPLSQCLQEFPEMAQHYKTIHRVLDAQSGVVHMLGRVGYATFPPATPRWPLRSRLIAANS